MYQISNEKFGLFVTELRKKKNLNQKDLAEKLYVSDKTVSKWERGLSMPNVVLLIPIADQNKKMRQLSGGMKRRVGLIQALLNNPDFLIIDEPTTGLDPEERIRIRNLLVDFSKDRTVLFSTHVVEDLAATCTQLAIMKKGSFLYSGSVSGLLENAKGCVWNCTVQNAEEARLLEANYSISSKQYVENGIHMKVLSKGKPNENCVLDNDITWKMHIFI